MVHAISVGCCYTFSTQGISHNLQSKKWYTVPRFVCNKLSFEVLEREIKGCARLTYLGNEMMNKKISFKQLTMILLSVVLFTMASCSITDDGDQFVDDRDQFVGDYILKVTGNFVLTIDGQNYSDPINETSSLTIYKSSGESIVSVSGFYDCSAYVSGNTISMDPMTVTKTQDGVTMQMIMTPRRGTLNGDVLTFLSDISGSAYYQGQSFPISGTLYNEATRQ